MQDPSSQCCLPLLGHWDPSDLSDLDDIKEAIDSELQSLSNPWSGEGDLSNVYCILSLSGAYEAMIDNQSHHPQRYPSEGALRGSNWKGCWTGRFKQGCPGPLTFTWQSVMAWAMALLPSCIVMGSAVR